MLTTAAVSVTSKQSPRPSAPWACSSCAMCCGQPGIDHRLRGQVHAQHDLAPLGLLCRQGLDGPRDDPAVDRLDEVEALGYVEEARGRDQVAVLALHAQQQLAARGRVAGERHHGLRVELEGVVGQGVADAIGPGHARQHALLAVLGGVVEDGSRAARLLRVVHRDVGLHQQLLGREVGGGVEHRHPDARRDPAAAATAQSDQVDLADRLEQALGDLRGVVLVDARQDHRELVAAEPGQDVGTA